MKKIIYLVAAFLCMACSDDHGSNQENGGASGSVTEVTPVTSDLSVDLSTDKAFYKPGEKVVFTAEDALPAGTKVRYRLLGEVVGEESVMVPVGHGNRLLLISKDIWRNCTVRRMVQM